MKKTLTYLLLLIGLSAQAQVTGNIQLVNIYDQLENDHSGIMIIFVPQSGGAVADTAYTDVNGDFSINLVSGLYKSVYRKNGYTSKGYPYYTSPGYIQAPFFNLPHDQIYAMLPEVYLSGNVNGTLQPFTHYIATDSLTVLAGDTLVLPEGSWLNILDTKLTVYGHLYIQGTSTYPAMIVALDSILQGYNTFQFDDPLIRVQPGGELTMENAHLVGMELRIFRGIARFNNVGNNINTIMRIDSGGIMFDGYVTSDIVVDEGEITIEESNISGSININVFSKCSINCSFLPIDLNATADSKLYLTNNYFDLYEPMDLNGVDTAIIENNITRNPINLKNTLSPDTSVIFITNNSFDVQYITLDDVIKVYLVNNLNFTVNTGNNPSKPIVAELKYNYITSVTSLSVNFVMLPPGPSYPTGTVPILNVSIPDTTDIYSNLYTAQYNLFVSNNFPEIYVQFDTLVINAGDPAILDPDGSRSDRGARYAGCLNPLVLQPNTTPTPIDSIYPGDANYDGTADNFDLLPIGYLWGETGPVRAGASLAWVGQYTDPWTATLPNGRNAKHADCDGSGLVDYDDVAAIYQNYGLTHTVQKQPFGDGLWLQFPSDSIFEGDTVEIKVMLGTTTQPVTGIAGLAFSITYDPAFVKPGSAKMDFDSCWLGTDSLNLVTFHREDTMAFRNDIALSRTDRVQLSGSGHIGTLIVVINDDILAKDSMTLTTFMDFGDISAKNAGYNDIIIGGNAGTVNVQVGYNRISSTVSNNLEAINIKVFPNPAQDKLQIILPSGSNGIIDLYTIEGKKVASTQAQENNTLTLDNLDNGLYILRIQIGKEMLTYKISVRH